jgi:hypothetical protein
MPTFIRKYSDQIIIVLVSIIMILLLIILTDLHVAGIDREMEQTIQQRF